MMEREKLNLEDAIGTSGKKAAKDAATAEEKMTERVSEAMGSAGDSLRQHMPERVSEAADAVSRRVRETADYFREEGLRGIVEDVEVLIRRYPLQTLLLGMGCGYLLSRLRSVWGTTMDNPRPISIAALASDLVSDLKRLWTQEIRLAQHEMQLERRKTAVTLLYGVLAIMFSFIAITFFLVMLVHALYSSTAMPLWACYGVVGIVVIALSGIFVYSLIKLGSSLRLWPFRTVHSIKEDAQWIKEQLLSTKTW
jgi:hypothetical protein